MRIKFIIFALIAFTTISCNEFLSEPTSKTSNIQLSSVEQLEALLNDYLEFYEEADYSAVLSSDDYELTTELYDAAFAVGKTIYDSHVPQFALWDTEYLGEFDKHFWEGEFAKIFTANVVTYNAESMTDGTAEQRAQLKAEGHFILAYSYLRLVTIYCLPYTEANKSELGLPLKTIPNFEEDLTRATLEATYNFIETNLTKALTLTNSMEVVNNKNRSWRASKGAANALAARYWLIKGDYSKALEYAEVALSEHSTLMDYNTQMYYSTINITPATSADGTVYPLEYPYTFDYQISSNPTYFMEWDEFYYLRGVSNPSFYYIPSQSLLNSYDQENDLRYKYHIVENYSFYYINDNTPRPGYIFFFKNIVPSGPTVAEMILIKAECQARLGDYSDAMTTVNLLRAKRIDSSAGSSVINLTATSVEDAVTKILLERRRETPFARRWEDIRRLNHNDVSYDDVEMKRTFYPYTLTTTLNGEPTQEYVLENGARNYACPIPSTDIATSQGELIQNIY